MALFPVIVTRRGGYFTKAESIKLLSYSLQRTDKYTFAGNLTQNAYTSLKRYCSSHKLNIVITNPFAARGNSYRRKFFDTYRPAIGNWYLCAYCGKPVRKDKLTIDHLYPVGQIKRSAKLQKKLMKMGYESVNDPRNLVPSCDKCNHKKAAKMGIWVIKGKIGRYFLVWMIRYAVRVFVIGCIFMFFYTGLYRQAADYISYYYPKIWGILLRIITFVSSVSAYLICFIKEVISHGFS